MRDSLLSDAAVDAALASLPGWRRNSTVLEREFAFADFVGAFSFMTAVALLAQARDHHPEFHNVYRHVTLRLTTHDSGGITERDLSLAQAVSALV